MPNPSALLALLLLAACAPVYDTAYTYVPPASAEGQRCTAQCLTERTSCARTCERQERLCVNDADSRAMRDYQIDLDGGFGRRPPISSRTYFDYADRYRAVCYAGACRDRCDSAHNACFEGCGGTVTAHPVCAANCDS